MLCAFFLRKQSTYLKKLEFVVALKKNISIICGALTETDNAHKCRSLAQLVEQLAFNQFVEGSNPSRPTTFSLVNIEKVEVTHL